MKGKKRTARVDQAKRQLIAAIMHPHNQKENPIDRETHIVIITRTFRILEKVWQNCGSEEVWNCLRSSDHRARPPQERG